MSVADETTAAAKLPEGELIERQKEAVQAFDKAVRRPVDARSAEAEQLARPDDSLAVIEGVLGGARPSSGEGRAWPRGRDDGADSA